VFGLRLLRKLIRTLSRYDHKLKKRALNSILVEAQRK
jgi:hypothetical protein